MINDGISWYIPGEVLDMTSWHARPNSPLKSSGEPGEGQRMSHSLRLMDVYTHEN